MLHLRRRAGGIRMGVLFLDFGCCFYLLFLEGKVDYFVKAECVPRMMEDPP